MIHKAAVLTISDSLAAGTRPEDGSGDRAAEMLESLGLQVERATVSDDPGAISGALVSFVGRDLALVVTTGGTGLGPRDVTPEATMAVVERPAPGLAEAMRAEGMKATPLAALSRGVAGIAGRTLIVNLPGSVRAVTESLGCLQPLLPHALATLRGDTAHD